jgi:mRNA-degrading endonuclease toxin of MazEF toxin-antitoxin module
VIKAERIAVIERSIVVKKLGSLSASKMEEVKRAVKLALNLD